MLTLRFLARVKALVRAVSSACWEVVWGGRGEASVLWVPWLWWRSPWMMAHPAAKGGDFWELPSINQCGVSGSRMGWSVKCWKGFWVRSTVRPQLCRRGPVVEDVGNKLAGLRGEHGENESWESRRKACRTCTLDGGRERKAQCDTSLGRRVENRLLKGHI